MSFVHEYKNHLQDVQRDRSLEQMLQSEDCFLTNNTPVLLVQTDGMDQAKWSVPRLWDRPSKEMGSVVRTEPELFFFAALALGMLSCTWFPIPSDSEASDEGSRCLDPKCLPAALRC